MKNKENQILTDHKPREKCGVFALYNYQGPGNAAVAAYLGLLALQHRGQESAGMAFYEEKGLRTLKGMGLVEQLFSRQDLNSINSTAILGHVRYSTTGSSSTANAQPLLARSQDGTALALAHNGNLTNTRRLYQRLLDDGHIFHSTSDTEIMLTYLFFYRKKGLVQAVKETMSVIEGAYAAVAMDEKVLVAFRDPRGFRPLVIGTHGPAYVFASETAALDTIGATFLREVEPGEIVSISSAGLQSFSGQPLSEKALCIFEYVYFARPDSIIGGVNVHQVRKAVGALLAEKLPLKPDLVIPSPDSGVSAAMGLAEALKVPLEWAVHRNPYLGRTFIEPTQSGREQAVHLKFNPISGIIKDKKVAIVDDSLVRGTTARILTKMLKKAGAAEVHLCIASPPYTNPCYYGIDIPAAAELAALDGDLGRLAQQLGADSIIFAEPDDLYKAVGQESSKYCTACFSGLYPGGRAK